MLAIRARVKKAYARIDEIEESIIDNMKVGECIAMPSGEIMELVNNFADKNVAYRVAAVRHFEVKVRKRKKGETL